ncbi:MAG: right-handed parallel beta-helix repeat-containing protein [Candidatus Micrarchaeia archaeon]
MANGNGIQNNDMDQRSTTQESNNVNNNNNNSAVNQNNDEVNKGASSVRGGNKKIILGVVVVVVVLVVAFSYFLVINKNLISTSTTSVIVQKTNSTSTVQQVTQTQSLSSCEVINQPGIYTLTNNITTTLKSGYCIQILSSDVKINGGKYIIQGSGPYIDVKPYTYGIFVSNVSNVTIDNLNISRFSFSVYLQNTNNVKLINIKISNSTLTDLFMNNSNGGVIENSSIYGSQSRLAGLNISNGHGNKFLNTSFVNNAYYAAYINSTGNDFGNDVFIQNPEDFICGSKAYLRNTNNFSKTRCNSNTYCNFAICSSNNYYSVQNVKLSNNINGCGSIDQYGVYTLNSNINIGNYFAESSTFPCITINAPNVKLNCNGKSIYNSYYGILVTKQYNTTVENCNLLNDTYGLLVNSSINTYLNNINSTKSLFGIYVVNSTVGTVSNSTENNDNIGVYQNASTGFTFKNIYTYQNLNGEVIDGGQSNYYENLKTINNFNEDLYCPANTYNSTNDAYIYNTSCGVTDCQFASAVCSKTVPPPLSTIPVFSCDTISIPGNYELTMNVSSLRDCIIINSTNVRFNCNNKVIIGSNNGYGILDYRKSNVSVDNCNLQNYQYGVYVNNASRINITDMAIAGKYGIILNNVKSSSIAGSTVSSFSNVGIGIYNGTNVTVYENNANNGIFNATGFVFKNLTDGKVIENTGNNNNFYGFYFSNFTNNIVNKNVAENNKIYDYYCGIGSGSRSNNIGINTGINKYGCPWLVSLNPASNLECINFLNSGIVNMFSDAVYTYGNTCYVINNLDNKSTSNSEINCNGHTIYAPNGGVFANISTSGVTISNCYLVNFTTAIVDNGAHFKLINTTILNAKTGVYISGTSYPTISNDNIIDTSNGIYIKNINDGSIQNNNIYNSLIGIYENNDSYTSLNNNIFNNDSQNVKEINSTN